MEPRPNDDNDGITDNMIRYCTEQKELTRRRDSERELFHDDIVHVEASAYAH